MKILLKLAKNSWKIEIRLFRSALFQMKTRFSLKYLVNDCKSTYYSFPDISVIDITKDNF